MNNISNSDIVLNDSQTSTHPKELYAEYQAALLFWKIWPPCVLLLGGFGNIATICVMHRIKDHNSSQHAILMALAMSDILLLYTGALRMWLIKLFQLDVRRMHTVICRLHMWIVYSTGATSAWLVTTVTIQRTIAVKWPHKMRAICTLRRTWIVIAVVVITGFVFYVHVLPGKEVTETKGCTSYAWYAGFYKEVFTSMDMYFSSVIPSVCQLVCDALLSWTLFQASSSSMMIRAVSKDSAGNENMNDKRKKLASRTTVMILALSCAFLVLTLPVNICIVWYNYIREEVSQSPRLSAIKELLYSVTFMMWYANSAVNFLLYCFTGTRFRREFLNWIRCGSPDSSSDFVGEVTSTRARNT